ncbi:claudin-like protein ZF-A89 [Nothobranchius furzeri]|uniref:Claudin n=1 Tax=Nothobranchius furzeri TaxID=105023 RepID=A0A9D3BQH8_NOTFU|nr:claudin-17 [Nothobranchius furzeri]KAF7218797.1 claudin-17-like [Nothobranchius furzeri]
MKAKLEILALVLGFIGLFGTVTIAALPTWQVSAYIGANLVVFETLWEGLWMVCYRQIDINMQCKVYDSQLILPYELQAARGLVCISIALVTVSMIVTGCGIKKSNCCGDNMRRKNNTLAFGGSLFLISFFTTIIPVSLVAHSVIVKFYDPALLDPQKQELGQSIFIGWATSGVLLATGVLLLISYSKRASREEQHLNEDHFVAEKDILHLDSAHTPKTGSSFKFQEYV